MGDKTFITLLKCDVRMCPRNLSLTRNVLGCEDNVPIPEAKEREF